MQRDVAVRVNTLLDECFERLNESAKIVKDSCSAEEFQRYSTVTGKIMAALYLDLLDPMIYREHPGLEPEELKKGKKP